MKPYKYYGSVRDGSQTFHYQFVIKISLVGKLYQYEVWKMRRLLQDECKKFNWSWWNLSMYSSLEEDRRHNKGIPKGYRLFRFGYTHNSNFTFEPSYPK